MGLETFDPYDFKGTPFVMGTFRKGLLGRIARSCVYGCAFVAPTWTRKRLGVRKARTAGGTAHLVSALIERGTPEDLVRAGELLRWLAENPSPIPHPGKGWGLPFGWHSVKVVPIGTPIGHTTMTVGNAFAAYHRATGENWAQDEALLAARFLTEGLNRRDHEDGSLSLSYTPLDESQCVNSNADIAAFLLRLGERTDDARRIFRFVEGAQNEDGSWFYMADDRLKGGSIIDGYHTGMILSALCEGVAHGASDAMVAEKGAAFYLDRLISPEGWTRFATDREFPLDAYSVGQAFLTLSDLARCKLLGEAIRDRAKEALARVHSHSFRLLQAGGGRLLYRRYRFGAIDLGSLRWAQAVTAWGLARAAKGFES
jgi:hypothetical protein